MNTYHNICFTNQKQVAHLMLNRPQVCNAFNKPLIVEVRDAIAKIKTSDARVLVLSAAGKHFCAGGDIKWMEEAQQMNYEENYNDTYQISCMFDDIYSLPIPTIAKVQGAAIGGGVGFVAACDMAVCSPETVFSLSEAKAGLVPACITAYLLHKIPMNYLRRYFLTGEKLSAVLAEKMGLVSEISSDLDTRVTELCDSILECGPQATQMAKELLKNVPDMDYNHFLEYGAEMVAKMRMSDEGREGFRAFLEKRMPYWRTK